MFDMSGNDAPWMVRGQCVPQPDDSPLEVRRRADTHWFPLNEDTYLASNPNPCAGCPVFTDCATWSIARPELEGIWAGLSTRQRAQLRGETPRPAPSRDTCGTQAGLSAHKRHGEVKCGPCTAEASAYKRRWSEARKAEGGAA